MVIMRFEYVEAFALDARWEGEGIAAINSGALERIDSELGSFGWCILYVEGLVSRCPALTLFFVIPEGLLEQEETRVIEEIEACIDEARLPRSISCPNYAVVCFSWLTGGGTLMCSDRRQLGRMQTVLSKVMGARFPKSTKRADRVGGVLIETPRGTVRVQPSSIPGISVSGVSSWSSKK